MAESEEQVETKSKGLSKKMMMIIGAAVLVAGGGGYFAMSKMGGGHKEATKEEAPSSGHADAKSGHGEAKGEKKGGGPDVSGHIYPLETFVVNLSDQGRTRYLKVTIQLEMDKQEATQEVATKIPQVKDALIILLSSKTVDEVTATEGKYQLRDEIVARVNQFLTKGMVITAYFTDFVVQ